MKALIIKDLKKVYASGFVALKGINLSIEEGSFFGLLGPNGAGKTTTLGIMTSLVKKSGGDIQVFGHSIDKEASLAKTFMGLVPQEFNFSLFDRVIDIVVNQAGYYGIPRRMAMQRAEYYLMELGLWDKRHEAARVLSGGMKRRLMIARALIHQPKILVLDEPTAGVDVELRRSMWDFLRKINHEGTTIILTTHYLEEIESLCDTVAILHQGKIIKNTNLKDLLSQLTTETILFDLEKPLEKAPFLLGLKVVLLDPKTLEIQFEKTIHLNSVFEALSQQGVQVVSMRNKTNRLEALFIRLVNNDKG
ncbi:MAG: ABC transporter ATP-binding protein [Gammaproteobacteria bacterium]|nr:ABC transporter ATP-binding protein [Gammaproteobacteria bacterium]MBP9729136.1 ABC transporter ATP-binding protein [Gammaproteobacteria bacterium]